jgi:hypothetical protein
MLWVILVCSHCYSDAVDIERRSGWQAEAALADDSRTRISWQRQGERVFSSQSQCLGAIRRELPETELGVHDDSGEITAVTHYPDYVESFATNHFMNATTYYACFLIAARTS